MKKHKFRFIKSTSGRVKKIFLDDKELVGVTRYDISNSDNYNDFDNNSKTKIVIEFSDLETLEIVCD